MACNYKLERLITYNIQNIIVNTRDVFLHLSQHHCLENSINIVTNNVTIDFKTCRKILEKHLNVLLH